MTRRGGDMRLLLAAAVSALVVLALSCPAAGQESPEAAAPPAARPTGEGTNSMPSIDQMLQAVDKATTPGEGEEGDWSAPVKLAVVFAALAILPSLLVLMTSFTRIVIVLSFARRALATQTIPPTVAIVGLALFLTLFTMSPTFGEINTNALQPYLDGQIAFPAAIERANTELKKFMLRQTRRSDLELFVGMADIPMPATAGEVPSHVAIPSFAISEFRTAFEMGCLLFIPFLLIDLVISAILLSAGMMMLPPVIISLPFKIILFVLVDGWKLLAQSLVLSFH